VRKKAIIFLVLMLAFAGAVHAASVNGTYESFNIVKVFGPDGQELAAAKPAINFNGTTMVPVRMLEQLGFTVEWDSETYSVTVTPPPPVVIEVQVQEEKLDGNSTVQQEPAEGNEEGSEENGEPGDQPGAPSVPVQPSVPSDEPGEQPQEPQAPQDPQEPTDPEPTEPEPAEPEQPQQPDNAAICQQISDSYDYNISMLSYTTRTTGEYNMQKHILEYEKSQSLSSAGCN
jgi:hypothetical protein